MILLKPPKQLPRAPCDCFCQVQALDCDSNDFSTLKTVLNVLTKEPVT